MNALDATSTRPYLIRALYEWCTDNGFTPYVAVIVDDTVQVPREYVKNNEIVLNISFGATSSLKLGNDFIEFKARFGGSAREIHVPIGRVIAIYARENGQGMAFPAPVAAKAGVATPSASDTAGVSAETTLSLASSPAAQDNNKPFQLVPEVALSQSGDDDSDTPPEPPKKSSGKRPALKRVK
ncbi:MAG: ClpXP protease specificity-enhancing factor [Polaromonas sp.]|nr:ClpXP protease specificity-enhancing factor [Polaromonas sp.]